MNTAQLIIFLFFSGASFITGVNVYLYLRIHRSDVANRAVYLGETLLLGATVIYSLFMLLSMLHLYSKHFLFAAVFINYLWLLRREVREEIIEFFKRPLPRCIGFYIFIAFLGFLYSEIISLW